jgi:ankyrin repeat protein
VLEYRTIPGELKFQKDDNGDTALILCAWLGDEKTMKYLLEDLGLDIKQTGQYGRNVFHRAVLNKNHGIQMAKLINEKDGELKFQKDKDGDTALTLCAWLGDEKTMKYSRFFNTCSLLKLLF